MDSTPLIPDAGLELRVLDGPQRGARAPLQAGLSCVLAADPAQPPMATDIVLRDPLGTPAAVRIVADRGQALIEVLHGHVTLAGQALAAGAQAAWPWRTPLAIGSSRIAFGPAGEDEWRIVDTAVGAAHAADSTDAGKPAAAPLGRRPEVWLTGMGAALLLLCAASVGLAHIAARPQPVVRADAATLRQQLQQQLQASEFASLQALPQQDGRLLITGRLGTLAQRVRLDAWLAARQASPALEVLVDEAIATEATEVFRINGIPAQVRSGGAGRLVVEAAERDAARLAHVEDTVRRDVRGIESLTLRNTAQPPAPPPPVVVDDPGKRIASLVPGEPAYVVTADGSRYFVGALLPSGHRIAVVAPQQLTLERDGLRSTLNF